MRKRHSNAPNKDDPKSDRQTIGRVTGTTGVRLTCTLTKPNSSFSSLQVAPALSGSRPTPRRHFAYDSCPQLCIWQSWRPLRSSSGDCGARAGGTGSAGCAGRRRIVAALGRGSLLWAPTKRGREHRSQTTCSDAAPGYSSHRDSPSGAHRSCYLDRHTQASYTQSFNVTQASARRSS